MDRFIYEAESWMVFFLPQLTSIRDFVDFDKIKLNWNVKWEWREDVKMNQENFCNVLPLLSSNYFYTVTEWIEIFISLEQIKPNIHLNWSEFLNKLSYVFFNVKIVGNSWIKIEIICMIMTLRPTLKRVFQKLENIFYKRLCTGLPHIISPLLLPNKNSFSFVVNCQLSSIRSVRVGFTFLVHLMLINWKNFRFYTLLVYWIWSGRLFKWCPSSTF